MVVLGQISVEENLPARGLSCYQQTLQLKENIMHCEVNIFLEELLKVGLIGKYGYMSILGPLGQNTGVKTHVTPTHPVAPTHPIVPVAHAEKPEKFNGSNFKRWQQKMMFYLTTLNLDRYLKEEVPLLTAESDMQTVYATDVWKHADYICWNYVLNYLADSLYNVYCSKTTSKVLWESLDHKYKIEDAGEKKWIVGRFLDYKMADSKTVVSQVQEIQVIIHDIHVKGMVISESFQVAAVIERFSSGWKDFKNYLKHKRNEMSMEDLIVRLRIEEDNRGSERKTNVAIEKENMVEH
ncbi:hypothetical protein AgCh_016929 [Apium graveolens]